MTPKKRLAPCEQPTKQRPWERVRWQPPCCQQPWGAVAYPEQEKRRAVDVAAVFELLDEALLCLERPNALQAVERVLVVLVDGGTCYSFQSLELPAAAMGEHV